MPLEWHQGLSVGVEAIDAEHRQILRRMRQLATALIAERPQEFRGALKFLQDHLVEHFANEELWMSDAGYPGTREHVRLHADLLDRVASAREQALGAPAEVALAAADLADALEEHMISEDLKLARFFTARENLRLLAEAGPGVGAALTPIPGSVAPVRPGRDLRQLEASEEPSLS